MRDELLEFLAREPFIPFRITLTSGQSYDVRFKDLLVVGKDLIHFVHAKSDFTSALRLNQVVALDMME